MPRALQSVAIRPSQGWRRFALSLGSALAVTLLGSGPLLAKKTELPQGAISVDELYVVDCLLPGQVRQLGGNFTYLSARRPIRTTAKDCAIRGGEYVAYDRADLKSALGAWLPLAEHGDVGAQEEVDQTGGIGLALAGGRHDKTVAPQERAFLGQHVVHRLAQLAYGARLVGIAHAQHDLAARHGRGDVVGVPLLDKVHVLAQFDQPRLHLGHRRRVFGVGGIAQ